MEKNSRLAVCILNWNGLAYTTACVESLLASTNQTCAIYILDNGSTVNEAEQLQKKFNDKIITYRSKQNLGFAGGYNHLILQLLKNHSYDYYLLLNQDTIVTPDCLHQLSTYLDQHADVAVVGPKVLNADNSIQSVGANVNLYTGKITSRHDDITNPEPVDVIVGNCFMARASAIIQLGLFDPRYFAYYEEADWCVRARQAGFSCVVVPSAVIQHKKSGGFRTYLVVRNMIWFEKKIASATQLFLFWWYFWCKFIPERVKKGSSLRELMAASIDGWLGLNKGKARFL